MSRNVFTHTLERESGDLLVSVHYLLGYPPIAGDEPEVEIDEVTDPTGADVVLTDEELETLRRAAWAHCQNGD